MMRAALLIVALALTACGDQFVKTTDYQRAVELCGVAKVAKIRVLAKYQYEYSVQAFCNNGAEVIFRMEGRL